MISRIYQSPIGKLCITSGGAFITGCCFADEWPAHGGNLRNDEPPQDEGNMPNTAISQCVEELDAYFAGRLRGFTVKIKTEGTAFRRLVWDELTRIPYGETINYRQLAQRVGSEKASRAVGGANHHNPIVIIIPCHRVIGADGSLTGYGGGLARKEHLLALERHHAGRL